MYSLSKLSLLAILAASLCNAQNPEYVEAKDDQLPTTENQLYNPIYEGIYEGSSSLTLKEDRGLIEDLPLLEKKVPAKVLSKPRNVTSASLNKLLDSFQYSLLSICPEQWVREGRCICSKSFKYVGIHREPSKDLYAVSGVDSRIRSIIVSYRATRSIKNWMTNLDYELIPYPDTNNDVRVHKGFYEAQLAIKSQIEKTILPLLTNPAYKGYTLHITGISLGAALATVSSINWKKFLKDNKLSNKMEVFAYSSPRCGNEAFSQYLADSGYPLTRYTNMDDVVTHLPPRSFGFVHAAAEIYEYKSGYGRTSFRMCDQRYDEDPNCGLGEQAPYSVRRHILPFNKLPSIPFC